MNEDYEHVMNDPRTLISGIEFIVEARAVSPELPTGMTMELPSSQFGIITFVDLIRANRAVQIIKEDGTVITYSMKDRPVDQDAIVVKPTPKMKR